MIRHSPCKPHLYKVGGLWFCKRRWNDGFRMMTTLGVGSPCPTTAYVRFMNNWRVSR